MNIPALRPMLYPAIDLFVNLAAGEATDGSVSVRLGERQLDYTWKGPLCSGPDVELKPNACHTGVEGHVGAEAVSVIQDGMPGLIMASGKAGETDFIEQLALDPACPLTGHYANLSGNFGNDTLLADVYRTVDGYCLVGKLGSEKIYEKLVLGPHGGVIDGHIGELALHQVVTTA